MFVLSLLLRLENVVGLTDNSFYELKFSHPETIKEKKRDSLNSMLSQDCLQKERKQAMCELANIIVSLRVWLLLKPLGKISA